LRIGPDVISLAQPPTSPSYRYRGHDKQQHVPYCLSALGSDRFDQTLSRTSLHSVALSGRSNMNRIIMPTQAPRE
jgi:hypothetical protein